MLCAEVVECQEGLLLEERVRRWTLLAPIGVGGLLRVARAVRAEAVQRHRLAELGGEHERNATCGRVLALVAVPDPVDLALGVDHGVAGVEDRLRQPKEWAPVVPRVLQHVRHVIHGLSVKQRHGSVEDAVVARRVLLEAERENGPANGQQLPRAPDERGVRDQLAQDDRCQRHDQDAQLPRERQHRPHLHEKWHNEIHGQSQVPREQRGRDACQRVRGNNSYQDPGLAGV
mmetsp:Transcript_56991/g.152148  ORF Transcript_56991/g.152148 Transcript_56991/m.152148 type:complete len:231 (-) Transcript_56991:40-732(-)